MTDAHGSFVWYELMTTDTNAAKAFYSGLLGWRINDDPDYPEIVASEGHVGGLLPLTPEMIAGGARPAWLGYLAVDDVDACVDAIAAQGGSVLMPARDMADVGRFAMIADPQGAILYLIRPLQAGSTAFAADRPKMGHCAWNELATANPAAAWSFYGDRFGWVKDGQMDMGALGQYEFVRHGSHMLGAIMPKLPEMPVSAWTYYFRVADIDAAAAYIAEHDGTILQPPIEIPGGDYSLTAADPQGAVFGLVGPRI